MLKKYILASLFIIPSLAHAAHPSSSMVVSAHPLASQAGIQILKRGGNAFDAAAATALALGVVEPGSSGIGGGGFFLLYIAKEKRYVMIDARETSPKLAGHGEIYNTQSSINGPQSAGVPGLLAGIDHLISTYGRMPRTAITSPAISLARNGFPISPHLQSMIKWRKDALNDAAQRIFLDDRNVPKKGSLLRQPALADTLLRFSKHGADDFYQGETAGRLVADMKRDGGLIREADLANYKVIERKPVQFTYHGTQFISAALPSSGGITMAETLGILQGDKLAEMSQVNRMHLLIEAMKRAYKDRNQYLGDGDFVSIPYLLNPQRLKKLRASIDMHKATPSNHLIGFAEPMGNSVDTTHFSIIDAEGNMVSATLSINYGMGSGYVSPSTGILMNDEMDDFATRPGRPNAYGLVQGSANAVAPGKRMLSSMSPTFVIDKDRIFIVGTPGGSRIISMVLLASIAFINNNLMPAEWVDKPRFHHQFLPDIVEYEAGAFTPDMITELKKRGHHLKEMNRSYGNMQAILWNQASNTLTGISDHRGEGNAIKIQP
ncbi:MAG: gamma-glutamyltransferase [Mariprofundaceae bacterium]|nr:gamma-glutamyltransferase [Mariprofundaceae bacterium]